MMGRRHFQYHQAARDGFLVGVMGFPEIGLSCSSAWFSHRRRTVRLVAGYPLGPRQEFHELRVSSEVGPGQADLDQEALSERASPCYHCISAERPRIAFHTVQNPLSARSSQARHGPPGNPAHCTCREEARILGRGPCLLGIGPEAREKRSRLATPATQCLALGRGPVSRSQATGALARSRNPRVDG